MRFGMHDHQSAKERRVVDQAKCAYAKAPLTAGYHHRGPQLLYRADAVEFDFVDFTIVATAVTRQELEIAAAACPEYQNMRNVALLNDCLAQQRKYGF